jgi:hypothetical protein
MEKCRASNATRLREQENAAPQRRYGIRKQKNAVRQR